MKRPERPVLWRYILPIFSVVSLFSTAWALPPVNVDDTGTVLKGYDTVAYFTMMAPVKGVEDFSLQWAGVRWLFSKQEHLDLFKADPEKYAPQYGGY